MMNFSSIVKATKTRRIRSNNQQQSNHISSTDIIGQQNAQQMNNEMNPGLVTFVQMDPQQQQQQIQLNQSQSQQNNQNIEYRQCVNSVRRPALGSIIISSSLANTNQIGSSTQSIGYTNNQQQLSSFANQIRFNQRQLTKGAMMNNNNQAQNTIHPPPGFGSDNFSQTSFNTHWVEQHHPMCEKNPECARNRILSMAAQLQSNHQLPIIRYPLPVGINSSSNNQSVIYDFINPNFNPSGCNNWPPSRAMILTARTHNQPSVPNQSFHPSYLLQQQRWILDPPCNHIQQQSQTRPTESLEILNRPNLNPNANDFFPSQQLDGFKVLNQNKIEPVNFSNTNQLKSIELSDNCRRRMLDNASPIEKPRRQADNYQLPQPEVLNDYVSKLVDEEDDDLSHSNLNTFEELFNLSPSQEVQIQINNLDDAKESETKLDDSKPIITLVEEQTSPKKKTNRIVSLNCASPKSSGNLKGSHRRRSSMSLNDSTSAIPPARTRANTSASDSILKRINKQDRYKTELCWNILEVGECDHGGNCTFAHGTEELRPKAPHDNKERTQPCESYSNNICYRGSSRCWYLHQKPEFHFERLTADLYKWLQKPFKPELLTEEWFDPDYNPIFYNKSRYQSRLEIWLRPDPIDVDFGNRKLNEHIRFHQKYRPIFEEVLRALSEINQPEQVMNETEKIFSSTAQDLPIKYRYNWLRAGTNASDHLIRQSFYSVTDVKADNQTMHTDQLLHLGNKQTVTM